LNSPTNPWRSTATFTASLSRSSTKHKSQLLFKIPFIYGKTNTSQALMIRLDELMVLLGAPESELVVPVVLHKMQLVHKLPLTEEQLHRVHRLLGESMDPHTLAKDRKAVVESIRDRAHFGNSNSDSYLRHIFKCELVPQCGTDDSALVKFRKLNLVLDMIVELLLVEVCNASYDNRDYIGRKRVDASAMIAVCFRQLLRLQLRSLTNSIKFRVFEKTCPTVYLGKCVCTIIHYQCHTSHYY